MKMTYHFCASTLELWGEQTGHETELQGFPSLYNYQTNLYDKFINQYPFLNELTPFFNGINSQEYLKIRWSNLTIIPGECYFTRNRAKKKQNTKMILLL
jgi:hypothetical protein